MHATNRKVLEHLIKKKKKNHQQTEVCIIKFKSTHVLPYYTLNLIKLLPGLTKNLIIYKWGIFFLKRPP